MMEEAVGNRRVTNASRGHRANPTWEDNGRTLILRQAHLPINLGSREIHCSPQRSLRRVGGPVRYKSNRPTQEEPKGRIPYACYARHSARVRWRLLGVCREP